MVASMLAEFTYESEFYKEERLGDRVDIRQLTDFAARIVARLNEHRARFDPCEACNGRGVGDDNRTLCEVCSGEESPDA